MRLCDQRASTRRRKEPSEDYVLNCQHNARGTLVQLLEWATDLHKCRTLTLTLAVHFVATYKEWFLAPLDSFSFLFLSFFFDFCFLTMIPSTFASAKTSTRYTLADTLRHSLGTTQVQCPQYKRTSPVGQDTQKEEGLTTDHYDGGRCRVLGGVVAWRW